MEQTIQLEAQEISNLVLTDQLREEPSRTFAEIMADPETIAFRQQNISNYWQRRLGSLGLTGTRAEEHAHHVSLEQNVFECMRDNL